MTPPEPHAPGHPFYQLPPRRQRAIRLKAAGAAIVAIVAIGGGLVWLGAYGALAVAIVPLQVAAPFLDTPSLARKGKLVYYAPLFLVQPIRGGPLVLHGGTLLDYWFVFDRAAPAASRRRRVMLDYARGLRELVQERMAAGDGDRIVRATTYFIGDRTARRLGLARAPTRGGQALILWLNAAQVTLAYSLLHRRLRFPPLARARTYEARVADLAAGVVHLKDLEGRLGNRRA